MLEKHEEDMEEFWFKVHAKNEDVDMVQWLCIDRMKGINLLYPLTCISSYK